MPNPGGDRAHHFLLPPWRRLFTENRPRVLPARPEHPRPGDRRYDGRPMRLPGSQGADEAPARAAELRRALDRAGYDQGSLQAMLGAPDARLSVDEQRCLWLWRARDGRDDRALLARLFLLESAVPLAAGRRALGQAALSAARALGLLRVRGSRLEPRVQLGLHAGLLIAGDLEFGAADARRRDHAGGPNTATLLLDGMTVRRPVARALDLGCGGGYLALRLAAHAAAVCATDVSVRALRQGRLNAALNGIGHVQFAVSDRFAALQRRRFQLITGNLPFVISPESRFVFRDAGLRGDGFLASVVRATGRHLTEGGIAQYLAQWAHGPDEEQQDGGAEEARLARWVRPAGCDALIIRLEREPVDVYASRWLAGPGAPLSADERARRMARWMAYYRRLGIRAISTGLFCLRRRAAARHLFAIQPSSPAAPPSGADIAAWFDAA